MSFAAIRTIIFRKSPTVPVTIQIKRDISSVNFDNNDTYKNQPKKRQLVIDNTTEFGKDAGLDAAGAEIAEIP